MASIPPPPAPPPPHHAVVPRSPAGPQFFVDQKRGELYELRQVLRALPTERDVVKQREALKKLIAYMTVGLDVSRLFADVVMLASTPDLVQKKMIYQYLTNYADTNPSLSLLAINTFQKDCNDEDPRLRGLAIRSLCSLRLSCMLEYIEPAARKGMSDRSPYVRRAAVMALLKACKLLQEIMPTDEEGARQRIEDIRQRLYDALLDEDSQVAINAICALNEIEAETGGMCVTKKIATHFLNRIKRFSEWGVCTILNLVATYQPESEEEAFDIMNILDDKLKSSSAAVVLACSNCFLELTRGNEDLRRQVYCRLKPPLLTLVTTGYPEIAYTILRHILLIVQTGGPGAVEAFEGELRQFFCRYSDPSYLKSTKLQTLVAIVTERNCMDAIAELREYVCDADAEIARQSIAALGLIACKIPSAAEDVVTLLLSFVDMEVADFLMSATFVVLRDILRKYPMMICRVVEAIRMHALRLADGEGVAAVVWMIGEFGKEIEDAPYILEDIVTRFGEEPPVVRLELLTAATKCFFQYPGEMQPVLGKLLEQAINDASHPDVHDRALFYYRFLQASLPDAKRIISTPLPPLEEIESSAERDLAERLMEEFNSLSVMYRLPSASFLCVAPIPFGGRFSPGRASPSPPAAGGAASLENRDFLPPAADEREASESDSLFEIRDDEARAERRTAPAKREYAGVTLVKSSRADLLLLETEEATEARAREDSPEEEFNGRPALLPAASSSSSSAVPVVADGLTLLPSVSVESATFQHLWESSGEDQTLSEVHAVQHLAAFLASFGEDFEALGEAFEASAARSCIFTMASGVLGDVLKMFFYGKDEDSVLYLCEMQLTLAAHLELSLTVKAVSQETSRAPLPASLGESRRAAFARLLREALAPQETAPPGSLSLM
ncbi:HEAT repeat-containing protein [Besnoitia besnoiti]|uniref:HEAT repeat-containing protein n=1 Tax=Besnoitia besnoiti TaxID=94643 RepID=A0A2A9MKC1_BESBE|nr:HEAT repeat-containing protein [Besnoitia besnoiti]PFH36721.1 HEAT repeat-containing protein [Besnoitia besnoiti]